MFLFVLHMVLAMISLLTYSSISTLESEPLSCRLLYPLNHFLYFILNLVLIFFYLSTIIATASANLKFFENNKVFGFILVLFSIYSILLKFVADSVCEFWTLGWSSVLGNLSFFFIEGMVVYGVFQTYVSKSSRVRNQMRRCIERLAN